MLAPALISTACSPARAPDGANIVDDAHAQHSLGLSLAAQF